MKDIQDQFLSQGSFYLLIKKIFDSTKTTVTVVNGVSLEKNNSLKMKLI